MKLDWKEILQTTFFTLLAVLIMRTAAFASYYIPSESMVPTLEVGDRILVTKWAKYFPPSPRASFKACRTAVTLLSSIIHNNRAPT